MRRKAIFFAIGILVSAMSFSGCKKDNKTAPATVDHSGAIKNTVWTGESNYTGKAVEPVSIAFNADGSLTFYELSGEHGGIWKLDNEKLTVSIDGTVSFKADIVGDNSLSNIQNSDVNGRNLKNAALNAGDDPILDNTTWTAPNLVLKFKPGQKVDMILGGGAIPLYSNVTYVRKGKSIRFTPIVTYNWFMITNSSTSMKGANSFSPDPTVYPFTATKQ
ncbi:MAG TPA: hypothetical protein VK666_11095 [Chryseolinea sp.]|nr:hypothetical protein [Chryseolinea sp.]